MATYNDEYTKEEDYMMWELHRIRKQIAEEGINVDKINEEAEKYLKENNLKVVKVVSGKSDFEKIK